MPRIFEKPADLLGCEGEKVGPTEWMTIEQPRIDGFADVTEDHQWIHVDTARAKDGPYGATIAHGYLTLALVNKFLPDLIEVRGFKHAVNVGLDKVRFLNVVPCGARIRGVGEFTKIDEVKGGVQSHLTVTVEVEGQDKPACIAETISRYFPE